MRDVHEVLQKKELDLSRVRNEVEALRIVASILSEFQPPAPQQTPEFHLPDQKNRWPLDLDLPPSASIG